MEPRGRSSQLQLYATPTCYKRTGYLVACALLTGQCAHPSSLRVEQTNCCMILQYNYLRMAVGQNEIFSLSHCLYSSTAIGR